MAFKSVRRHQHSTLSAYTNSKRANRLANHYSDARRPSPPTIFHVPGYEKGATRASLKRMYAVGGPLCIFTGPFIFLYNADRLIPCSYVEYDSFQSACCCRLGKNPDSSVIHAWSTNSDFCNSEPVIVKPWRVWCIGEYRYVWRQSSMQSSISRLQTRPSKVAGFHSEDALIRCHPHTTHTPPWPVSSRTFGHVYGHALVSSCK